MPTFRIVIVSAALAALLAACSSASPGSSPSQDSPAAPAPTAQPTQPDATDAGEPTPGTTLTACEVVAPTDIEVALDLDAGTVAEGVNTPAPTVLDPARNECRYDHDWGGLVVDLVPTGGVNVFDAVESVYGEDAEALDVGDGALWFEANDRGYFLKGSVMVLLQFTHVTEGGLSSFRDPTIALGEAAVAKI